MWIHIARDISTVTHTRFFAIFLSLWLMFVSSAGATTDSIDFKFADTAGKTYQLSELKGKWVLVNFWAPWCPLCWVEIPELNQIQAGRNDIVIIGIAMDYRGEDSVQYLMQKHKIDFPVVMGGKSNGPNSPIKQIGPVPFYPTTYLYAPNGRMVMTKTGTIDRDLIENFIFRYSADKLSEPAESVVN